MHEYASLHSLMRIIRTVINALLLSLTFLGLEKLALIRRSFSGRCREIGDLLGVVEREGVRGKNEEHELWKNSE